MRPYVLRYHFRKQVKPVEAHLFSSHLDKCTRSVAVCADAFSSSAVIKVKQPAEQPRGAFDI